MTEQDKQALIEYYCNRDCGHTREECCLDNCHEIMLIEEFPTTPTDADTISRQAAIDALGEKPLAWEQGEYEEGLQTQWESDVEAIKALPSAEPHWIPVTERLPEKNGDYLCQEKLGFLYVDTWKGECWDIARSSFGIVVAWMPLPEHYKG